MEKEKSKGRYSKEKGKRGEREIVKLLKENGFGGARRTAQYCGSSGDANDVVGIDGFGIEVKYVERLNIWQAMAQAERDCEAHYLKKGEEIRPVVLHRISRHDWLATMPISVFMELAKLLVGYNRLNALTPIDQNIMKAVEIIDEACEWEAVGNTPKIDSESEEGQE